MGKLPQRKYRPLYLGEWLDVTGHEPIETAAAVDVDVSYIRNLIANRKRNPGAHILLAISEHIGVTVNDLYRRPPSKDAWESISGLSIAARDHLLSQRRK